MEERVLGKTGRAVSVIGLGTWQLGADWGDVSDADALATLEAAAQAGVTFLDTADVYGDGRSERLIGRFLVAHPGLRMTVATKMGRRVALDPALYTLASFREWTEDRGSVAMTVRSEECIRKGQEGDRCRARKRETPSRREGGSPEKNPALISDIPCHLGSLFLSSGWG